MDATAAPGQLTWQAVAAPPDSTGETPSRAEMAPPGHVELAYYAEASSPGFTEISSHNETSSPGYTELSSHAEQSAAPDAAHTHHVTDSWLAGVYDPGVGTPIDRIDNATDAVRNVDRWF